MGALNNYIAELKQKIIEQEYINGGLNEVEIIRIIYIDLGKKMNFDVGYTFGNSKQRKQIYGRLTSDEELDKAFENRTIICKSLAFIVQKILKEFGIKCSIVSETDDRGRVRTGAHVYNLITLQNGRTFTIDLEEDLEYIQTGSKTRHFGLIGRDIRRPAFDDKTMRRIDTQISDYIPEGYYLEDMLWMLEKSLGGDLPYGQKFDELLANLNKYRDISKMGYRDRILYYEGMIEHFFGREGFDGKKFYCMDKIEMFNCYKIVNDEKRYISCIITSFGETQIYLFNDDLNCYEKISIEQFLEEEENGLVVPNERKAKQLKRYKSSKRLSSADDPEM